MSSFSAYLIGSESLLVQCAEILLARGHAIRGVISDASPVRAWAAERGVRALSEGPELASELSGEPFDYFFAITHLAMIPQEILALPTRAAINFHDGPLPRYAGLNATSWALLSDEATHGITWHVMTEGADEGDLLKQRVFDIAAGETALTLNTKCWEAGIESFGELVDELSEDRVVRTGQDLAERTYYGRHDRPRAACSLSFDRPAAEIGALIRALDYGGYANPLGVPLLWLPDGPVAVRGVERRESSGVHAPGEILGAEAGALRVATVDDDLMLSRFADLDGAELTAAEVDRRAGSGSARVLEPPGFLDAFDAFHREAVRHEAFWVRRLARLEEVEVPFARRGGSGESTRYETFELEVGGASRSQVAAGVACLLRRLGGKETFRVAFRDEATAPAGPWAAAYRRHVPLRVRLPDEVTFASAAEAVSAELARASGRGAVLRDVRLRRPELATLPARPGVAIRWGADPREIPSAEDAELVFALGGEGAGASLHVDSSVYRREDAQRLAAQLAALLDAGVARPESTVARLPLQGQADRERTLGTWNDTASDFDRSACVHDLFAAQSARTPDRDAVVFEGRTLSYAQLDVASNRLAHHLRGLGVGPDVLVGLCLERSLELLVGVLGIQKAGGAYVPLDPAFPPDRLSFMIEDAGVPVLVTQESLRGHLGDHPARVVSMDGDSAHLAAQPSDPPAGGARPEDLAYVIYTSGSTGKPKGVQVEHRNVVNFFHGMDGRIDHGDGDVWLAVTSLSFDISVLELLWTLARGFTVVVHSDREREAATQRRAPRTRPIAMNFFYFSADAGENPENKYRLLMEGARFADRNGFNAVWTPERHFHDFGGLYPNPAVTGAAVAAITENVEIRAGSVVLPLHHPVRVAEEWSVVDNLSRGRVGVSVAAGWQPNDFILRPEGFENAKQVMFDSIETVRKLWRGERVTFPGPKGDVAVTTLPRPLQAEIPIWVTTAGTLETWVMAGEAGCNVLTHLLGQTVPEVGEKVAAYRAAWRKAGHAGQGIVSLMLHTFVSDDDEAIRETVRGPMKAYLRTAMSLVQEAAWQFPTFKEKAEASGKSFAEVFASGFSEEEQDAVLEFAFERYFETSGLFGTPESCSDMVDQVAEIDVDEIACLIDFGVPTDEVLGSLKHLARLCAASAETVRTAGAPDSETERADHSLPALIRRHGVTHFQCTPSMASMLLLDDGTRAALGSLHTFLLGGEALPESLARDVASVTSARVVNMYGPTETTIWSTTHDVKPEAGKSIGRAIANTKLYVVDGNLEPRPVGVPGELLIGGEGVVRGYLNRPELTAERFVDDPFVPGARVYRTGDLVRWSDDGELEFLGRIDHQVKIRGYRIELGEIEARLAVHEAVREAVVVAREDIPGDKRLVAYYLSEAGTGADEAALRAHLRADLPEYMIPAAFVPLAQFPLTPNAKVDRNALPAPEGVRRRGGAVAPGAAPQNGLQKEIAELWQDALGVDAVGLDDNFFDLGGHSLLAVRVHRDLKERVERPLSITDMFRLPTVRALSAFLAGELDEGAVARQGEDRAAARRDAMARRRSRRRGRGDT